MRCPILILDFGSQYTQLIARRVRSLGVYCEVMPYNTPRELIPEGVQAYILSGGPRSINEFDSPKVPDYVDGSVPVLGICYGLQALVYKFGGTVRRGSGEYGRTNIKHFGSEMFDRVDTPLSVWMSHGDSVEGSTNWIIQAQSKDGYVAAVRHSFYPLYGLQFHPEVVHTEFGEAIINNFIKLAKADRDHSDISIINKSLDYVKETAPEGAIICGLSGGVDSMVAAKLVDMAVGKRLYCVYVDTGLMRKGEMDEIRGTTKTLFSNPVTFVDASRTFLSALKGVSDPEQKRKIIGREFINSFEGITHFIKDSSGPVKYLVQGTLYPDVIESVSVKGPSAVIKSHHNVGGLPDRMNLKLIEPLRTLFKDEVRILGHNIGLSDEILWRQPFPGPGLAIRILSDITSEKIEIVRNADQIVRDEFLKFDVKTDVWQIFCALLPVRSVGVMGDDRTYGQMISVRCVSSVDGMTADWVKLPYDLLEAISTRITNEVAGVNRVVYDITSKPPATIEYE